MKGASILRWLISGMAVLTAAALLAPARAQELSLPKAEEVIQKAIDAMGGAEAMAQISNRRIDGRMELPAMGIKAPWVVYWDNAGRIRTVISSDVLGKIEAGGDGTVFWETMAMTGPKIKKGPELALARKEADLGGLVNWRTWYAAAETAGADSVDAKPAWKVVLTPKEGAPETWYFDQANGLPVRISLTMSTDQGEIPAEQFMGDYRQVDGLLVSFYLKQTLMGGIQTMEFFADSLRHNIEIPAGTFDFPPEVAALLEKERAAAAMPAEAPAGPDK